MTKFYYTIFNLVALSVVLYLGVDIFYRVVRSQLWHVDEKNISVRHIPEAENHKRPSLTDFKVITDRNLFGSLGRASKEVKPKDIETLEPTTLKIALIGTVTSNREGAYAVIEETDKKKQALYRVGDSVKDAVVKVILRGKVILRVGDKDEVLTIVETSSTNNVKRHPTSSKSFGKGTNITVSRSDMQMSLKDINKVLAQVRIKPHFKDGKGDGLAITQIKARSIFSKLGLRNGDIVQGINGSPIKSPDDILSLYEKFKSAPKVSLQIKRMNKLKTINYLLR